MAYPFNVVIPSQKAITHIHDNNIFNHTVNYEIIFNKAVHRQVVFQRQFIGQSVIEKSAKHKSYHTVTNKTGGNVSFRIHFLHLLKQLW